MKELKPMTEWEPILLRPSPIYYLQYLAACSERESDFRFVTDTTEAVMDTGGTRFRYIHIWDNSRKKKDGSKAYEGDFTLDYVGNHDGKYAIFNARTAKVKRRIVISSYTFTPPPGTICDGPPDEELCKSLFADTVAKDVSFIPCLERMMELYTRKRNSATHRPDPSYRTLQLLVGEAEFQNISKSYQASGKSWPSIPRMNLGTTAMPTTKQIIAHIPKLTDLLAQQMGDAEAKEYLATALMHHCMRNGFQHSQKDASTMIAAMRRT